MPAARIVYTEKFVETLLSTVTAWFHDYAEQYSNEDEQCRHVVAQKKYHSLQVADVIVQIGIKLSLDRKDLYLAKIIGLLHDVGRFEQFKRFRTLFDRNSVDHGRLGVASIEKSGILNVLSQDAQQLLIKPILYHNQARIPKEATRKILLLSRLIRDADKVDIFRFVCDRMHKHSLVDQKIFDENFLDSNVHASKPVLQALMEGRIVAIDDVRSQADLQLMRASWLYDVNFKPTLAIIREYNYLKTIRSALPPSKAIDYIFDKIEDHIEEHLRDCQSGEHLQDSITP